MKRVGVDVGGTFTDLISVDEDKGEVGRKSGRCTRMGKNRG